MVHTFIGNILNNNYTKYGILWENMEYGYSLVILNYTLTCNINCLKWMQINVNHTKLNLQNIPFFFFIILLTILDYSISNIIRF